MLGPGEKGPGSLHYLIMVNISDPYARCPLPAMVLSLLPFFRPVKKASLLSGRVPTTLFGFSRYINKTVGTRPDNRLTFCLIGNKK